MYTPVTRACVAALSLWIAACSAAWAQAPDDPAAEAKTQLNQADKELKAIRSFLFHRMYRAPSVMVERAKVTRVVNDLFPLFLRQPELLPAEWRADILAATDEVALARIVADYVAGMTDRFALQEHQRLLG